MNSAICVPGAIPLHKPVIMPFSFNELLTVIFTLFAVIDIIGSIPILISLKQKMGGINEFRATLISGALMILFLFAGEEFLQVLGLDIKSFAGGQLPGISFFT